MQIPQVQIILEVKQCTGAALTGIPASITRVSSQPWRKALVMQEAKEATKYTNMLTFSPMPSWILFRSLERKRFQKPSLLHAIRFPGHLSLCHPHCKVSGPVSVVPSDLLSQHRSQEKRPDPVDLRRGREVQARHEDVGRGEVGHSEDRGPDGVVAYVVGEGRPHVLEGRRRGRVVAAAAAATAGGNLGVDEEVCEVAIEHDHDGEGATPGGRGAASDEDEDRVGEAGEPKLKTKRKRSDGPTVWLDPKQRNSQPKS